MTSPRWLCKEKKGGGGGGFVAWVRASPVVLSMRLCENIFTSKFSYPLVWNPTNKTETGTAKRWKRTTNSKPPGPIIMMGHSETVSSKLDHIHYTLFCRFRALLRPQPSMATCAIMLSQNHFSESNRHMFDFVHPILLCRITYRAPLERVLTYFLISKEDKQLQSLI
jgi:hypothetical protein